MDHERPGRRIRRRARPQGARGARAPFGRTADGQAVESFTLTNAGGIELRAITYGAIIVSLRVPDRDGRLDDVVLGYDTLAPVAGTPFDFRKPAAIGLRIAADDEQIRNGGGYDHNFVLNGRGPNRAAFPSTVVRPGQEYRSQTVLTFGRRR